MTIERFLGCAESVVLKSSKPMKSPNFTDARDIYDKSYDWLTAKLAGNVYVPRLGETRSTVAVKEAINGAIRTLDYTSLSPEQLQAVERFEKQGDRHRYFGEWTGEKT